MNRRLEIGPLLVALGGALLLVSLFLDWFEGRITAWEAFEVWDVVLALLGAAAIFVALATIVPDVVGLDRRALAWIVGAVVVVVASQIINPPPAAAGQDPDTGSWLALGAAVTMLLGAVLTFGRVSFAVTVEGRDRRRRVAAVDHREPASTAETGPLFARSAHEPATAPVRRRRVAAPEGEPPAGVSAPPEFAPEPSVSRRRSSAPATGAPAEEPPAARARASAPAEEPPAARARSSAPAEEPPAASGRDAASEPESEDATAPGGDEDRAGQDGTAAGDSTPKAGARSARARTQTGSSRRRA